MKNTARKIAAALLSTAMLATSVTPGMAARGGTGGTDGGCCGGTGGGQTSTTESGNGGTDTRNDQCTLKIEDRQTNRQGQSVHTGIITVSNGTKIPVTLEFTTAVNKGSSRYTNELGVMSENNIYRYCVVGLSKRHFFATKGNYVVVKPQGYTNFAIQRQP